MELILPVEVHRPKLFRDDSSTDGIVRCISVMKKICYNLDSKFYGSFLQVCHFVLTAIAKVTDKPLKLQWLLCELPCF
jgi:hypothetical protein